MMAVGAFLAAALSALVLRLEPRLAAIGLVMAAAAGVPTLPPIARRLARLGSQRIKQDPALENSADNSARPEHQPCRHQLAASRRRLARRGPMLDAAGAEPVGDAHGDRRRTTCSSSSDLPRLVAAVAFAVVAGFLSMLPGGLVVRDALLMQLLAPMCGEANALVAAVLLRLVWLVSEVAACGILYVAARTQGAGIQAGQAFSLTANRRIVSLQRLTYNMLSVIIPVLDEAESLPQLVRELDRVADAARLRPANDHRRRRLDGRHLAGDLPSWRPTTRGFSASASAAISARRPR